MYNHIMKIVLQFLTAIVVTTIFALVILNTLNPAWWQNAKLGTTTLWGYMTISNNPLLPGADADLIETDYKKNEIEPRISPENLFPGGPPKDGIPSIDKPQFVNISDTEFDDDNLIIGFEINGEVKAYPYSILNWHEIVNDTVGGEPVSVTYCPLCETNSVFKRTIDGIVTELGVSGKLFESCLVMYDRLTDTLYSQPWGTGIIGERTNTVLERVPATRTTIGAWKEKYPESLVMTSDTGFDRDYSSYPYGSYYTDNRTIFSVSRQNQLKVHPKEISQIVFVHDSENTRDRFSGESWFLTQREVAKAGSIAKVFNEGLVTATWDRDLSTIIFKNQEGGRLSDMALFGFVYPAHFQ